MHGTTIKITVYVLIQYVITEGDRQSLFKFVDFTHLI